MSSETVFGRLNGEWKVGVSDGGLTIVHTGIVGVEGWQLVCRPNSLRGESATEVARLIAAAPELLEAARLGLEWSDSDGAGDDSEMVGHGERAFRLAARSAIAKAEGRIE